MAAHELFATPSHVGRTAFLSSGRDSYGVRRSLESLFRAFELKHVQPTIICLQEGEMLDFAHRNGIRALVCPVGTPDDFDSLRGALRNARFMMRASEQLSETIRASGADSLIVRQPYQVPLAARAAHLARVRGFWLMPNLISDRYPLRLNAWIYDLLLARYGMTAIANSHHTHSTLTARFARSAVAHLGIDPAEFDPVTPPAPRTHYGFSDTDAVFGIFARLIPCKGQLIFVRALARVLDEHPSARLLICGGPLNSEYADTLRETIRSLGLEQRVALTGPADRLPHSLPSLYAMCDVVVNCRLDAEPFGLSVIEGMLAGKPLLVHALGGPAETVVDGEHGWHVTTPDVEGFACGLRRALLERSRWHAIGATASRHARSAFTHVHAAERIIGVMRNIRRVR
jgi:glycosyltransferase involved in cell wall biosynthesis